MDGILRPRFASNPGLQLNLTLIEPTDPDPDRREVVGSVAGTFALGEVELPIFIGATYGDTTSWSFGLQPGHNVILPSFSSLLGLAGGKDFLDSLPSGLSEIPQIKIDTLRVDFDPAQNELTRLSFGIQTTSSWPIIAGYFEMVSFLMEFEITNLTDSSSRTIVGEVRSLFLIGSIPILCSIEKTENESDWTISGGLPPGVTVSIYPDSCRFIRR